MQITNINLQRTKILKRSNFIFNRLKFLFRVVKFLCRVVNNNSCHHPHQHIEQPPRIRGKSELIWSQNLRSGQRETFLDIGSFKQNMFGLVGYVLHWETSSNSRTHSHSHNTFDSLPLEPKSPSNLERESHCNCNASDHLVEVAENYETTIANLLLLLPLRMVVYRETVMRVWVTNS